MMDIAEDAKGLAAERAVAFVRSGTRIGLGTGSTIRYVLEELAQRLRDGRLIDVAGVPTSEQTTTQATALQIPLTTLAQHPDSRLTIDGADEIDPALNLIKGLGGALLREKIVAFASDDLVDRRRRPQDRADAREPRPLPVEVLPFALPPSSCTGWPGFRAVHEVRRGADSQPFVTDEGNCIVDCHCGPIADPAALDVWNCGAFPA